MTHTPETLSEIRRLRTSAADHQLRASDLRHGTDPAPGEDAERLDGIAISLYRQARALENSQ